MRRFRPALIASAVLCGFLPLAPAHAIDLLSGLAPDSPYGERAMSPNDDESSSRLNLPFSINFFGETFDTFFVNNNGNISFRAPLGTFTPSAFPIANQPMIAPWWGDVDTRRDHHPDATATYAGGNNVYVATPNPDTVVVTWDRVGYYGWHVDKLNSFQLVLRNRADTGAGNFDIDFRYHQLQWTTGDASWGYEGLGGVPAQAGYDDGKGRHYLTLPGSRTDYVLNLAQSSNVSGSTPGLWTFAVRNGETPGLSPSNPLMPVVIDNSFVFDLNVVLDQRLWLDPELAVGYDFSLASADAAQSFQTLVIGTHAGDGVYSVFAWDGERFVEVAHELLAGELFDFRTTAYAGAVRRFRIGGIEVEAGLDPANPSAFVTGLTFDRAGAVQVSQTPLVQFVPSVPEPASWAFALGGLALVGAARGGPARVTRRRGGRAQ